MSHIGQGPEEWRTERRTGGQHSVTIRGFGNLNLPLVSHITVVKSLSCPALSVFICEMGDNEDDNGLLGIVSDK